MRKFSSLYLADTVAGLAIRMREFIRLLRQRSLQAFFLLFAVFIYTNNAKADYTVGSGSTVDASTITGQSGVLTINGTLNVVGNGTVSLTNFTSVIINGPNGQIFWTGNGNLVFSASVTITINSGAPGLQPTGGSASQQLMIGSTIIAVSNDNANNAAFSFDEFNAAGGLPQFILGVSAATVCSGTSFTATITPLNSTVDYDCTWTISAAGTKSPASHSNFNSPQTTTITPTATGTYTVSCTLYVAGDNDPIVTKTKTVTVNAAPSAPSATTATPATICQGSTSNLKATSAGNSIQWYTVSSGGTSIGSSASTVNFPVTPAVTTTYYSEAKIAASGCTSNSRSSVTVTVNPTSVGGSIAGSTTVCSGTNSNILTLSGYTGSITRWESSINNFATAPTTIANTTASLTVNNLATTTYYRAVVTSGICSAANSTVAVLTVSNPGTWLGVNTDWNSTLNWCNGAIPTSSTNVVIPNGLSFYPVVNTTALANNITVATGGTASITVTGTLKFAGSITSTNGINASAGTIELIGTTAQTIRADNFVTGTVADLKITNTLGGASAVNPSVAINAAGGMLKVSGTVSFGNLNNAVLQTNDNITLLSTAAATASVADISNNNINTGNAVAGKIVIERYIPARRAWRLLTAPVTAAGNVKISDSWQEGAARVTNPAVIDAANNPNPGYGTHITFGLPAASGYDQGVNGNSSIFYLTSTGWNGVPTATNNGASFNSGYITDQPGYMLFVRGDRSTPLSLATTAVTSPATLRIKGNINTGQQNITLGAGMISGSSHFRVIGNPYPSAINFHKLIANSTNISAGFADAFYFWDPNVTGSNGVGGWVAMSYNNISGTYDRAVLTSGSSGINNSGDIQSGSAFMIDYAGAATTLRMEESNKATASNNSQFRPAGQLSQVRVSLLAKNSDNTISVNDAALLTYDDSYNSAVDKADMKKLRNFTENFSIKKNQELLVIERRGTFMKKDTVEFQMTQMKQKNYVLELALNELHAPQGTIAILEDKFLDKKKVLDMQSTNSYDFNVVPNSPSAVADRFRLLFKPAAEYSFINGSVKYKDAFIEWSLSEEFNIDHFEIERSEDGIVFSVAGNVDALGNSGQMADYNFTDKTPVPGNYFYRIKAVTKNGVVAYSDKVNIKIINSKAGMYVFPNPVTGNSIQLQMNKLEKAVYTATLMNESGNMITTTVINYEGGMSVKALPLPVQLPSGIYLLNVATPGGKAVSLKVFVQNN